MKKALLLMLMGFFGIALFAQTTFDVGYKNLPKDTQKYITKNYAGYTVDKAMQAENEKKDVLYYDVYVSKDTKKLMLTFDKEGSFMKETPVKQEVVAPKQEPVKEEPKVADTTKKKK
jgi:hypothetical protein